MTGSFGLSKSIEGNVSPVQLVFGAIPDEKMMRALRKGMLLILSSMH
jgi:hypothetical protein